MKLRNQIQTAIYTRKSISEGLDQEVNSLDAQREFAEAYIRSQESEGWIALPKKYDDGGYSGASLDRPGLKQLLDDISSGLVDCVVVYKVDRISRSLADFARLMEFFDENNVTFVSVTQQFNTTTSMGRLTLNVLLSFAQFEREMIAERTRDKVGASRAKGLWTGGIPPLGYDICDGGGALVVNQDEARRVRQIYELYLELESISAVVKELRRKGWRMKKWTNRKGDSSGGSNFSKSGMHTILRNRLYLGKVRFGDEEFDGVHKPIIGMALFQKVQDLLARNDKTKGPTKNKHSALLKGLLKCGCCGTALSPSRVKKGSRIYRYYVCSNASREGWDSCEVKSIPAGEIEDFIVSQLKELGTDADLQDRVVTQLKSQKVNMAEDAVRSALEEFGNLWIELNPNEQIELIRESLYSITVYPDSVEIAYNPEIADKISA
ncbi:MAG: recombinase family protein [Allomuricauda sp.]